MRTLWCLIMVLCGWVSSCCAAEARQLYDIYYLPLEAEFYVPPTREYILEHGVHRESDSSKIAAAFGAISTHVGTTPTDEALKRLRVLITDKRDGREFFITAERSLLSGDKQYEVDAATLDELMKVIVALCTG